MRRPLDTLALCALAAIVLAVALSPATAEEPVVQDVIDILKERGIVDEDEYNRLSAKNQKFEQEHARFMPTIEWFGDFRGRYEGLWFDRDNENDNRKNRHRARYRFRIGGKTEINDYIRFQFRLRSGEEHDSGNQTLGDGDDFDPDFIGIDQAFMTITPYPALAERVPGASLAVRFGKVPNPFRWKHGKDLLWDGDITPEGVDLLLAMRPLDNLDLFLNGAYYIVDEESLGGDPHVFAVQGGGELGVSEQIAVGSRISFYSFHSIDPSFVVRHADEGNVLDGLSGDVFGEHGAEVIEFQAYANLDVIEDWPIVLYGGFATNLDAEESDLFPEADDENLGWNVGMELGDKKKWVMLGGAYVYWEANFFPAQFVDSDMLGGITNREGWVFYGSRQILPNTDLNLTLYYHSDEIEDFPGARRSGIPMNPWLESVRDAERINLRADLVIKF